MLKVGEMVNGCVKLDLESEKEMDQSFSRETGQQHLTGSCEA